MLFYMVIGAPPPAASAKQLPVDEDLFRRIGQDDPAAFEALYRLTERTIHAYVLSILKNPDDTQDIVQETYLKIRAAAHLYQPQGKPLAWMFTIARNLSMSFLRRQKAFVNEADINRDDDLNYAYVSDPTDRLILSAAMGILDEQERQIILLHLVSGLKHREIAQDLDMPLSTVLSRYHRALKKLKRHIQEKGGLS